VGCAWRRSARHVAQFRSGLGTSAKCGIWAVGAQVGASGFACMRSLACWGGVSLHAFLLECCRDPPGRWCTGGSSQPCMRAHKCMQGQGVLCVLFCSTAAALQLAVGAQVRTVQLM
jgi:hypothetical protein